MTPTGTVPFARLQQPDLIRRVGLRMKEPAYRNSIRDPRAFFVSVDDTWFELTLVVTKSSTRCS